jgi:hypothetical protein
VSATSFRVINKVVGSAWCTASGCQLSNEWKRRRSWPFFFCFFFFWHYLPDSRERENRTKGTRKVAVVIDSKRIADEVLFSPVEVGCPLFELEIPPQLQYIVRILSRFAKRSCNFPTIHQKKRRNGSLCVN